MARLDHRRVPRMARGGVGKVVVQSARHDGFHYFFDVTSLLIAAIVSKYSASVS
jgi:hypothetical protein